MLLCVQEQTAHLYTYSVLLSIQVLYCSVFTRICDFKTIYSRIRIILYNILINNNIYISLYNRCIGSKRARVKQHIDLYTDDGD